MPMVVRAKAMVSERKRMVITAMAAMDIMAPRLVAYVKKVVVVLWFIFVFFIDSSVLEIAVIWYDRKQTSKQGIWVNIIFSDRSKINRRGYSKCSPILFIFNTFSCHFSPR